MFTILLFAFVQAAAAASASPSVDPFNAVGSLGTLGFSGVLVYLIQRADKRHEELTKDFRAIVQDNTAALTKLSDRIDRYDRTRELVESR